MVEDSQNLFQWWFQQVVSLHDAFTDEVTESEELPKAKPKRPKAKSTPKKKPKAVKKPPADVPEEMPELPEEAPELSGGPPVEPSRSRFKLYIVGAIAILLVIVASWTLGSIYFSRITVATRSVSTRASDTDLTATLKSQAITYKLTIQYPDSTKKQYPFSQLGLTVDSAASVKATRNQQHQLARRIKWWQPIPASVVIKTNQLAFNNFIANEANVTVQPSKDAVLSIIDGEIKLSDSVAGKQYGLVQPKKTFREAASSLKSTTVKLHTLKVSPALTEQILEPYKASLAKTISQPVSFKVGYKTVKPSQADIAGWLEITPDDKSQKVNITVNSGKVLEYIDNVAANYIHPAKAQIETTQPDGSTKVLVAGVNGVDVTNKTATAAEVAKTLLDGKGLSLPLPVNYESFKIVTTGSYDKWIEVDLTHKRMYAYEKDSVVKTELVTAGAPGTPTVTGQYAIYAKYDQQDMRGSNVDGSNYFQPHVRWINYFYRDYAIHGNYWRPLSYFGNINSSHGCVSVVESEAEWMYSWAPIGTPVIVHT